MAIEKSISKEFHSLMKKIGGFSDGQATIAEWDEEELKWFCVMIEPNDGLYKDAAFEFEFQTDNGYPDSAPRIVCKTPIYHPNIDTIGVNEGEICLNLLDELWTPDQCGLEDAIQGVLFLLYNPNVEDPLCSIITPCITQEEFEENVALSLAGKEIDGTCYFDANPKYAQVHPERCRREESAEEEKKEEEVKGDAVAEEANSEEQQREGLENDGEEGKDEEKVKDEATPEGQTSEEEQKEEEGKIDEKEEEACGEDADVTMGTNVPEERKAGGVEPQLAKDMECTNDLCELARTDDDIVSDEDLERICDDRAFVEEANQRNIGTDADGSVGWSNLIYGTSYKTMTENIYAPCAECTPIISNAAQGTAKDCVCACTRTRPDCRPTVTSRFFMALQTRIFRRFFV